MPNGHAYLVRSEEIVFKTGSFDYDTVFCISISLSGHPDIVDWR